MQISNHSAISNAAIDVQQGRSTEASRQASQAAAARTGDATAKVSSQSALIHAANTSASDVRMDKVQSVQSAIASGNYHVDAGKVADKLIDSLTAR